MLALSGRTSEPVAAAGDEGDPHREARNRKLTRNVAVGLAGRVANVLLALATVPLLLKLLGTEGYGIYVTITAAMAFIQLGIVGAGKGLVNTLVAAHARGDEVEARRTLWSFWAGLGAVALAMGALAAAAFPLVPWSAVFPAAGGIAAGEISRTVGIAIAFTLVALVFSPVGYVLSAYQDERKSTVWTVIRNAATLAAVSLVWVTGPSMSRVALATGLATTGANLAAMGWLLARNKPFLRPRRGDVHWDHLSRSLGPTLTFFAIDVSALLAYQTDKLLILHFAGATAVAAFELASIPFLLAQSVFGVVLMPMWPALGDAVRRGDQSWARIALARLARWSTLGMAGFVLLAAAVGPEAIRLWTGSGDAAPGRALLVLVGTYYAVRTFTECHTIVLFSLDRQRELVPSIAANGVLTVALGIVLGRAYGILGVVVATVIALAVTQAVAVPRRARRHLAALTADASARGS
jgi:O-antigen/teichoic acid export membrane protein